MKEFYHDISEIKITYFIVIVENSKKLERILSEPTY